MTVQRPPTPSPVSATEKLADGELPDHAFVRSASLTIVAGPDAGLTVRSSGVRMSLGRHESVDLRLSDPSVSQFHCELELTTGRAMIRDLQSKNGTLLDGVAVREAFPTHGSVLTIGQTKVRVDLGPGQVPVPLAPNHRFGMLVGRSPAMRSLFAVLDRAAAGDATILIEGETGTGKEVVAESVHLASARRDQPFAVVDCASIPPDLLESELFGHERGAFTGAIADRRGAFEDAQGGTVFLDEIGELAPELQPKLLRVLERREVKRVGSNRYAPVDCRVIAATSRNLRAEVNERRFRADLYYRLAVVPVRMPPLRDRPDDLDLLVEHFLASLDAVESAAATALRRPEQRAQLARHAWPGNVRELRNYVERSVALGEVASVGAEPLTTGEPAIDISLQLRTAREQWVHHFERRYLVALLEACGGNVSAAARRAGVDRPSFYRLLWRAGLR